MSGRGQGNQTTFAPSRFEAAGVLRNRRTFVLLVLLPIVVFTAVCARGIGTLPPESHDTFPAQTAYEMHERGSWIVPYYNGQLRLNKPPLGYWVTGAIAAMTGADGDIRIWHARAGSVLGGILLLLATAVIGTTIFGRTAALLGVMLGATAFGLMNLAHSGRPDGLYAGLCAWQLAAFVKAREAPDRSGGQMFWALGFWLFAALAILAKGPQIPMIIVVGSLLWLAMERTPVRRVIRTIRPFIGLALCAAVAGPWFWLLMKEVDLAAITDDVVTGRDDLKGSNLRANWLAPLGLRFYTYYPIQAARMFMPWVVWIPLAVWVCITQSPVRRMARGLMGIVVLTMVVFGFGAHQRGHYLVPLLPIVALLAAAGILVARERAITANRPDMGGPILLAVHAILAIGFLIWVVRYDVVAGSAAHPVGAIIAALAVVGLGIVAWRTLRSGRCQARGHDLVTVGAITAMAAVSLLAVGPREAMWQGGRFAQDAFARKVAAWKVTAENDGTPLVMYRRVLGNIVYYTRGTERLLDADDVRERLARSPSGRMGIVIEDDRLDELPADLAPRMVFAQEGRKADEGSCLVLVGAPG